MPSYMSKIRRTLRPIKEAGRTQLERAGWLPRRSFALNALDHKLLQFIDFRYGFFVEAGGNDGITQSNSYFFEKYLGWRGILVEPVPHLAQLCRQNRRRSRTFECALVSPEAEGKLVDMQFCNLMTIVDGARGSPADDASHLELGRTFLAPDQSIYNFKARSRTLSSILDEAAPGTIDLLSLDVEGYEAQALKGLDFARHRPRCILVEANYPKEIDALLSKHYRVVAKLSHHDVLYEAKGQ